MHFIKYFIINQEGFRWFRARGQWGWCPGEMVDINANVKMNANIYTIFKLKSKYVFSHHFVKFDSFETNYECSYF